MRLFLDQMIDLSVAVVLQELGHDVECAQQAGMGRADDLAILKHCIECDRVLITLDEHFGDWTVARLTEHPGVIRLKVDPAGTRNIQKVLLAFLDRHSGREFRNILAIVRPKRTRWIHTA